MPNSTENRKKLFKASLALAGITAIEFAKAQKVTTTHLYEVLAGNRVSRPLNAEIDAFIAKPRAPKPNAA